MSEEIREREIDKGKEKEQGEKLSDTSGAGLPPNFSQLLDKVLANPEIITAVASALSQNSSKSEEETPSETSATSAETVAETPSAPPDIAVMAQKLPEVLKLLTPSQTEGKKSAPLSHSADSRACLLNAMKPYMSKQRCEAIDYIVGFSRIADVLKHLK